MSSLCGVNAGVSGGVFLGLGVPGSALPSSESLMLSSFLLQNASASDLMMACDALSGMWHREFERERERDRDRERDLERECDVKILAFPERLDSCCSAPESEPRSSFSFAVSDDSLARFEPGIQKIEMTALMSCFLLYYQIFMSQNFGIMGTYWKLIEICFENSLKILQKCF